MRTYIWIPAKSIVHIALLLLKRSFENAYHLITAVTNAYHPITARDKYQTRMALERANLNTAIAVAIWSEEDCEKAASKVGFPMIIKPTSGGGSQGMCGARPAMVLLPARVVYCTVW
jgi:carbamoylphosphate synthase large subunit